MIIRINKNLQINKNKPPLIIAEISGNHCGKKSIFLKHIKQAAKNGADLIKIQTFKANAVDTVGAGDTFAGGFLYGINNELDYEESGKLASALSSKVVTKLGPRLEKNIIDNIKHSMR